VRKEAFCSADLFDVALERGITHDLQKAGVIQISAEDILGQPVGDPGHHEVMFRRPDHGMSAYTVPAGDMACAGKVGKGEFGKRQAYSCYLFR
jgi:hypothetical protein